MRRIKLLLAITLTTFVMNGFIYGQDTTLTITSNGNVGIGITDPTQKLVVDGFLRVTESNRLMLGGPFSAEYLYNPNGTSLRIHVGNDDRITIGNGGRVGIGTTNPTSRLHIHTGDATTIDLSTSSTTEPVFQRFFHSTNLQGGAVGFDTDDNVLKLVHGGNFNTSTNGLTIASDGNVGIGTTSPTQKLVVDGNLRVPTSNRVMFGGPFSAEYIYNPNGSSLRIHVGNDDRITIANDGNVGIGTTSPNNPLEMGSGAHVTAGGVWTDASSREYKENISNLTQEEAIAALAGLNPVKFNYKSEKDEEYVGFIAEDVPDLVATKDRQSLSPMDIVAVLTKVVQQQQKKIAELEVRLNAGQ
jgi:hypothetical protein